MKFLHDAALSSLTSELTGARLRGGCGPHRRTINGRIEAYIMKRAGTDKRVAHELGERLLAEAERDEREEMERRLREGGRKGSSHTLASLDEEEVVLEEGTPEEEDGTRLTGKSGPGGSRAGRRGRSRSVDVVPTDAKKEREAQRRARARSFDQAAGRSRSPKSKENGAVDPATRFENWDKWEAKFGRGRRGGGGGANGGCRGRSRGGSSGAGSSPLGDLRDPPARRLLTDLILTLNASFPDYDFSDARPAHFARLGPEAAAARINERLSEYAAMTPSKPPSSSGEGSSKGEGGFLQRLWAAVDDVIVLKECEVYSYCPTGGVGTSDDWDDDPLGFLYLTLAGRDAGGCDAEVMPPPPLTLAPGTSLQAGAGGDGILPLWAFNYLFVNQSLKRIVSFSCVQTVSSEDAAVVEDDEEETTPYVYPASAQEPSRSKSPMAPPPMASGYGTGRSSLGSTGYYSLSSSAANSDVDFDLDDDGGLARSAPRPAGAEPAGGTTAPRTVKA